MLEKRVIELFESLKHEKNVILFIDEIHTIIGTGISTQRESLDIANIIKPYITNDNIKIIGATTISEYNEFIVPDKAFSRRFNTIKIDEPTGKQLEDILYNTIVNYSKTYNIKVTEKLAKEVSKNLVSATIKEHRDINNIMYNPDLSIEIISNAFGYARLYDRKEIVADDFKQAFNNSNKVRGNLILSSNKNSLKPKIETNIIKVDFSANKKV